MLSVKLCPGFNVTGIEPPTSLKFAPASTADVIEMGRFPADVTISSCVIGIFKAALPKAMLDALNLSADAFGMSCKARLAAAPGIVAVSVADWAVLTVAMLALNPAEVALAGTVTVDGKVTSPTLLESCTLRPPLGAAAFN